ncbi:Arv1-domain-containing protein [Sistotremastrum niveocremeum HHB9708]|uniref:Protein ARV n=1 Tax=Sistotremastrum niveocremeum HHB9708 TaxID=1314777 RepID=A0A164SRK4_9AGAM|nr:Arv1-domain-containing protein [Sistotremastrum niveocremeum HHB9708]
MPICITCTKPLPYLYTLYNTAHNLRLESCENCGNFADPYIEHDAFVIVLDLILLKRGVYRHLLFNRGSVPRRGDKRDHDHDSVESSEEDDSKDARNVKERWEVVIQLGLALVFLDALETVAFHGGIMAASYLFDSLTMNNRPYHIPLTLLYSSLPKLFLLFLLTIWPSTPSSLPASSTSSISSPTGIPRSSWYPPPPNPIGTILDLLTEEKLDREWVVRNVLGGMAVGFGLRVVLDCHSLLMMLIILVGWSVKTLFASLVSSWIQPVSLRGLGGAGGEGNGDVWLAYSIP